MATCSRIPSPGMAGIAWSARSTVGRPSLRCCGGTKNVNNKNKNNKNNIKVKIQRRDVLVGVGVALPSLSSSPPIVFAETDIIPQGFRIYTDEENKFKISIPREWRVGVGEGEPNGFKSVTAFYPQDTTTSNVSVIITGLGPDFTKMESFGKVEEFAETLVSGLDRSWKRPPGVAAKLINSKSKNGFYYIDYSLQSPGESLKYLYSALGMASNGWYNRLYTVTGQFEEGDSDKYGSMIQKAVASFTFN